MPQRKLRIPKIKGWSWHRSGWGLASRILKASLHDDGGILTLLSEERFLVNRLAKNEPVISEPFVLFSHLCPKEVPHNPRWGKWSLPRLFEQKKWKRSLDRCRGIWCLTERAAEYVRQRCPSVPVSVVYHPAAAIPVKFRWADYQANERKHLVTLGQFLRRLGDLIRLDTPGQFTKAFMPGDYAGMRNELQSTKWNRKRWPKVMEYMGAEQFDRFLARNIVFLSVYDASANNGVLDCLVRHTPILVNDHPAVKEYLGLDYPLYFDGLAHAARLLREPDRFLAAHEYLRQSCLHDRVDPAKFAQRVADTDVYTSL